VGGDTDVEEVVWCGHPLAVRPVNVGACLLHTPAFIRRELQPGQAAHVVVVRDRGAGYHRRHAIDVGVTNQQGASAMVVVHLASFRPIAGVRCRPFQAFHDIGNSGQDQI
jgi:hypothetical protein